MTDKNPLIGTWVMVAWFNEELDGTRHYPLGEDATGYISYSADGFVFVHISGADRAPYSVNDPFGATEAEDSRAMKSHITYAGPYEFLGDRVIHDVTQASCPNWLGSRQVRMVDLRGDALRLSASGAYFQGREVTAYVDWVRAG